MHLFLIMALFVSCSFKPPKEGRKIFKEPLRIDNTADSDGDGLTDVEELSRGEDPFIANLPEFNGDLFREMKVTSNLYRSGDNSSKSVSFHVTKTLVSQNGVPAEERDFLGVNTTYLNETITRLAKEGSFKASHLEAILEDGAALYSPPRMNDLKIFPYSEKLISLSKTHKYESLNISILSKIKFDSTRFSMFQDPVFDLYYFDSSERNLKLIDSKTVLGAYEFGKSYSVGIDFYTSSPEITKVVSESGGRFVFLKIRDYKIVDSGRYFKEVLDSIRSKAIQLNILGPEKNKSFYVGANGRTLKLQEALDRALKNDFTISNNQIFRIGELANSTEVERTPYGESQQIQKKWFLLTNNISNNPFIYDFGINDQISLGYIAQGEKFNLTPHYKSFEVSSSQGQILTILKVKQQNILDLRLTIKPKKFDGMVQKVRTLSSCNETTNSRLCFEFANEKKDLRGLLALPVISILSVGINGTNLRLSKLIDDQVVTIRQKNREAFEVKFTDKIFDLLDKNIGLTLTLSSSSEDAIVCEGLKICESGGDECMDYFRGKVPSCEEGGGGSWELNIIDNTKKTTNKINGELFLSVEYL